MRRLLVAVLALAPAAAALAAGSAQVVTLTAFPAVAPGFDPVVLSGAIEPAQAGELVTVEGKECGVPGSVYRAVVAAQTQTGGGWSVDFRPRTKTVLRATWGRAVSAEVTVLRRAQVNLVPLPDGRLRVSTWGVGRIQGKRAVVQRFDRATRAWRTVRSLALRSNYAEYAEAEIRVAVPKGTTLRAVLPAAQAGPCYLAGYSKLVRT